LHKAQQHPGTELLEHVDELLGQIDSWGVQPLMEEDDEDVWVDDDDSDGDDNGDVQME
jgi:hypothetical protein